MNIWTRWFQLFQISVNMFSGEFKHILQMLMSTWSSYFLRSIFSSYVKRILLPAEEVVEKIQKQFICQQLLSIFSIMDLSDEVGK